MERDLIVILRMYIFFSSEKKYVFTWKFSVFFPWKLDKTREKISEITLGKKYTPVKNDRKLHQWKLIWTSEKLLQN